MKHLLQHFKTLTKHPKNAEELKGVILQLAIQGKLTENWRVCHPELVSGSNSASKLLERIKEEKKVLITEKKIKKEKSLPEIELDEVTYELPKSWEWTRLGNLGDWGSGATPKRTISEYYGGNINWFKSGELNNSIMDYESAEKITDLAVSKTSVRMNQPGDVLIAMYGATIGKTGLLKVYGTTNQAVCACTCFNVLDNQFLLLALKALKSVFVNQGEGGAQPNISRVKIRNQIFALPPLEEQKAIVASVKELFKEVEQLEEQTKTRIQLKEDFVTSALQRLIQTDNISQEWQFLQTHFTEFFNEKDNVKQLQETILQLAVQGKLTAKWRTQNPELVSGAHHASELLQRIQTEKQALIAQKKIKKEKALPPIEDYEKPYGLPEGWVWCRMQDLCPNISSGSTPPKPFFRDTGIPYLKVYNIRNQKIDFGYKEQFVNEEYHSTKLKRSILNPGDVIMNIVGPPLGKVAIIPDDYPEWNCNQAISFFKPIDKRLNVWLYTFLLAGTFLKHIELIGTAGQDNISVTKSKMIMVPLPPLEEQKAIVKQVNSLMTLCHSLEEHIEHSQTQIAQLMQSCLREVFEN